MYESFYGLRERPFDLVPNPRFLFLTSRQREALSNLQYGLTTPRGLTLLLGEAGSGKTTLVQAALGELRESQVKFVLLSNPTLTRGEFYEYLTQAFELAPEAAASKTKFLLELRREMEDRQGNGVLTALIIDEAQSVPYELLEEVRLLGNIETPTTKLLNIVLAGQPELADRLNEPSLRQLKQRISLRCQLTAMNLNETASYIAGRIRIAGGRPELVFTREAVSSVFDASAGLPRTVNVICDNALIGGFAAQVRPISAAFVEEVCRDFDIAGPAPEPDEPPDVEAVEAMSPPQPSAAAARPSTRPTPRPVAAPAVKASGQEAMAPMFGTVQRKRRFSFF
jgi:type II secretory pathway predicted ATPase ExeA